MPGKPQSSMFLPVMFGSISEITLPKMRKEPVMTRGSAIFPPLNYRQNGMKINICTTAVRIMINITHKSKGGDAENSSDAADRRLQTKRRATLFRREKLRGQDVQRIPAAH